MTMCFINDCDWSADIVDEADPVATDKLKCDECGADINPGDVHHTIYQQQHEICQRCESDDCDCPAQNPDDHHECKCQKPDYGTIYRYKRCHGCELFLKAVAMAEVEAGCAASESRPSLEGMIIEIGEAGPYEAKKYHRMAKKMFPELVTSGYLRSLYQRLFA